MYYHFLRADNAVKDLQEERIRVSRFNDLNDPFELLPWLRYERVEERKPYYKARDKVGDKCGLLCFSKSFEESLLWGHYADKHKGIALGFEIHKDDLLEVEYTAKRPKFRLTGRQEKDEIKFRELAKVKYEKWSYEAESRVLVDLGGCTREGSSLFLPFSDRLKLREIVLGARVDKQLWPVIRELAERLSAKVVVARLEWGGYRVQKNGRGTADFYKN